VFTAARQTQQQLSHTLNRSSQAQAWLTAMAAGLLLSGCGVDQLWLRWFRPQEFQRLEQRRHQLQRCQQQRPQVVALVAQIRADQQAMASIQTTTYQPAPPPPPPDPELERRYSPLDRELDNERYIAQRIRWQAEEAQRFAAWQRSRSGRLEQVQSQLSRHVSTLQQLNPRLFKTQAPARVDRGRAKQAQELVLNRAAVERYSQCRSSDF